MKVKLLKKLRKRFYWYRQSGMSYWWFYDKKTNETNYAFIIGVGQINDALIISMLSRIGLKDLYEPRYVRRKRRIKEKEDLRRKQYFSQFFK
jgi:hypothetical protein